MLEFYLATADMLSVPLSFNISLILQPIVSGMPSTKGKPPAIVNLFFNVITLFICGNAWKSHKNTRLGASNTL